MSYDPRDPRAPVDPRALPPSASACRCYPVCSSEAAHARRMDEIRNDFDQRFGYASSSSPSVRQSTENADGYASNFRSSQGYRGDYDPRDRIPAQPGSRFRTAEEAFRSQPVRGAPSIPDRSIITSRGRESDLRDTRFDERAPRPDPRQYDSREAARLAAARDPRALPDPRAVPDRYAGLDDTAYDGRSLRDPRDPRDPRSPR